MDLKEFREKQERELREFEEREKQRLFPIIEKYKKELAWIYEEEEQRHEKRIKDIYITLPVKTKITVHDNDGLNTTEADLNEFERLRYLQTAKEKHEHNLRLIDAKIMKLVDNDGGNIARTSLEVERFTDKGLNAFEIIDLRHPEGLGKGRICIFK